LIYQELIYQEPPHCRVGPSKNPHYGTFQGWVHASDPDQEQALTLEAESWCIFVVQDMPHCAIINT
jgi:hypothetical protein